MATRARQSTTKSTPRQSTAGPPQRQTSTGTAPRRPGNDLPRYEAPSFPLNPAAQRALDTLLRSHDLKKLEASFKDAQDRLCNIAAEVNDRVTLKEAEISKKRKAPAEESFVEDGEGADDVEKSLDELREKVERMTQRMDESMRKLIDGQAGVQTMKMAVSAAATNARANASTQASTQVAATQRSRRSRASNAGADEGEGEDEDEYQDFTPTDPRGGTQAQKSTLETFKKTLEDEKIRYESQSLTKRYAETNEYKHFRRMVNDAQHPDGNVPLPNANEWFEEDSEAPAPGMTTRARRNAEDDDSDDDLAVSRMTISTKCPLTLVEFAKPLTSKKCPHSFEEAAILELIRTSNVRVPGSSEKMVQCPVSGCSQNLTKNDLHTDAVLVRQIKRMQYARQLQEADGEDGDRSGMGGATIGDDDGPADVDDIIEGRIRIKGEPATGTCAPRGTQRGTQNVVELGSESNSEAEKDIGEETMDED